MVVLAVTACGTWDPTNQAVESEPPPDTAEPTDGTEAAATMSLTVGDQTYSFSVDECFASPDDGIRLRGSTEEGEQVTVDYSVDAPRDRTLQVTGEDNQVILDGNAVEGVEDPQFEITEDGFSGTATFQSSDGSDVDGEMSGTC